MSIREAFERQSRACADMGSPFMGRLMALLGAGLQPGDPVSDRVLHWQGDPGPSADSVPLRLAGGLHALKLQGIALGDVYPPHDVPDSALWQALVTAMNDHADQLLDWLDRPPQTNEVRRSAVLIAALGEVARRAPGRNVALFELGASGGLNLWADHYGLSIGDDTFGADGSRVTLTPKWTGRLPVSETPLVTSRQGVDLSPLNPTNPADRLRFQAYLWPDQPERQDLTTAALAIASTNPASIAAGDAAAWLEDQLGTPRPELNVVFHTVAWQYFPEATRERAQNAMRNAASATVQIGMEADGQGPGAGVTLTDWPSGKITAFGRADFHGRWIDWH